VLIYDTYQNPYMHHTNGKDWNDLFQLVVEYIEVRLCSVLLCISKNENLIFVYYESNFEKSISSTDITLQNFADMP
jgi:hypothetical protein